MRLPIVLIILLSLALVLSSAGYSAPSNETHKLVAADASVDDFFGWAAAIDGSTAIVGAIQEDSAATNAGAVYIFDRDEGGVENWGEVTKVTASSPESNADFGWAVSLSGDTLLVGAHQDSEAADTAGSAHVFERDLGGADNWGEVKKLFASDAGADAQFGESAAIDGEFAVVGAIGDGLAEGAGYLFARNQGGAGNWGEVKKLIASEAQSGDELGFSADISGDTVILGSHQDGVSDAGAAYIFQQNEGGSDNWGQVVKLLSSDIETGDEFGDSVAIDGDTAVVGAERESGGGPFSGAAYIFGRDVGGGNNWGEIAKIVSSDLQAGDEFGTSAAIDGDNVLIGARNSGGVGAVYQFSRNRGGIDNWGEVAKFVTSVGEIGAKIGNGVRISGDSVIAGSHNSESAYIFTTPSISGTVTEEGTGTPLEDVCVNVYTDQNSFVTGVLTDASGEYSVGGLASGLYILHLGDCSFPYYHVYEYYNDAKTVGAAERITVTVGAKTSVDVSLALGGQVRGTVTEEGTGTPLTNICITGYTWPDGDLAFGGSNGPGGGYWFPSVPAGEVRVEFRNCGQAVHLTEWFNNASEQASADSVVIVAETETTGVDIALALGGSISGTVTEDGSGTPLSGICARAYDSNFLNLETASTDISGDYTISALPAGNYRVKFQDCGGADYEFEWYADEARFEDAHDVAVALAVETTGIDAALRLGGNITGTLTQEKTLGVPVSTFAIVFDTSDYGLLGIPGLVALDKTDGLGQYSITRLRAGSYQIAFCPCATTPTAYEWYDDQPDRESADFVVVTVGGTISDVDAIVDTDADGDGCSDLTENGPDELLGGLRDYKNPWDYYDVAIGGGAKGQDGRIDLFNDVDQVIQHYAPFGLAPYDVWYDRGPASGNAWNMTAPDGKIDLFNDIAGVISQFGHNCG